MIGLLVMPLCVSIAVFPGIFLEAIPTLRMPEIA